MNPFRHTISGLRKRFSSGGAVQAVAKAVCITGLAFLLSMLLISPFTASTSAFFSSPEQEDFKFSDIYAQVADDRPVRQLDPNIVMLDIGNYNRAEIAQTLMYLSLCNPRAVGLDVLFAAPRDSVEDAMLIDAVRSIPGIILACSADQLESDGDTPVFAYGQRSFFTDSIADGAAVDAATNLPSKGEHGRIRHFVTGFATADGNVIPSFSGALARSVCPEKVLAKYDGNIANTVRYHSHEFTIIPAGEIADRAADLDGKIVIVGSMNDAGDMHATPVNSYYPGALIHAHSLATMMDGITYTTAPGWLDYVIAALVCFGIVLLCISMKHMGRSMLVRVLQIFLLVAAVTVGYSLFVERNIICNFSHTLLMIAFGLFSIDLWNGTAAIGRSRYDRLIINKKSCIVPCKK